MSWPAALAIYFVIWWTILFAVLPFGVRSQIEEGHVVTGSEGGAPARPRIAEKALWTSLVAAVIFAIYYANYVTGFITLDDLPFIPRYPGPGG